MKYLIMLLLLSSCVEKWEDRKYYASTLTEMKQGVLTWTNFIRIKDYNTHQHGTMVLILSDDERLVIHQKNVVIKIKQEQEENE